MKTATIIGAILIVILLYLPHVIMGMYMKMDLGRINQVLLIFLIQDIMRIPQDIVKIADLLAIVAIAMIIN